MHTDIQCMHIHQYACIHSDVRADTTARTQMCTYSMYICVRVCREDENFQFANSNCHYIYILYIIYKLKNNAMQLETVWKVKRIIQPFMIWKFIFEHVGTECFVAASSKYFNLFISQHFMGFTDAISELYLIVPCNALYNTDCMYLHT